MHLRALSLAGSGRALDTMKVVEMATGKRRTVSKNRSMGQGVNNAKPLEPSSTILLQGL